MGERMADVSSISDILNRLRTAKDPVKAMQAAVLEHGGNWQVDREGVFYEIQFLGSVGLGISCQAAVSAWIRAAEAQITVDTNEY